MTVQRDILALQFVLYRSLYRAGQKSFLTKIKFMKNILKKCLSLKFHLKLTKSTVSYISLKKHKKK